MPDLILLTESYPLGALTERAFIEPELDALRRNFSRVILVPTVDRGDCCQLPQGVEVSRCIVDSAYRRRKWLRVLLAAKVNPLWLTDRPAYALAAASIAHAVGKMMRDLKLDPAETLGYSFWFDIQASALAMLSKRCGLHFVSRAHRYDILLRGAARLRTLTVGLSSGIWTVSEAGARKLVDDYPEVGEKIRTAYLGIDRPHTVAAAPQGGKLVRIVSCSRVVPGKRVELNIRFVKALAVSRPDWKFELTHIGGSPEDTASLTAMADAPHETHGILTNFSFTSTGNLPNKEVLGLLATGGFDWYLLLSESEGLPVAMMEAMALGIPPIVTDVGGVTEAVDDDCGIILPPDPDVQEMVLSLSPYLDSPVRRQRMAQASLNRMRERFDASDLRARWSRMLLSVVK